MAPIAMPAIVIPTCTVLMKRTGLSISSSACLAPARPAVRQLLQASSAAL